MHEREAGYEIVYKEAIRALDLQQASFEALRARVGLLVSAATVATSFLGGLVLRARRPDAASWIAIGLFGALGAVVLRILWPRIDGADGFTLIPSSAIAAYLEPVEGDAPPTWTLYRDMALAAEDAHRVNLYSHLRPVTRWFRASILLLVGEVATWIVDLALG
jgi:hypothetical protein